MLTIVWAMIGLASAALPFIVIAQTRKARTAGAPPPAPAPPQPVAAAVPRDNDDDKDDDEIVLRPSEYARYKRDRIVLLAVSAGFLAFGLYTLVMWSPIHAAINSFRYYHWPKTTATIVKYDGKHSGKSSYTWRVYHFELDGRQYEGQGPYLGGLSEGPLEMPVGTKLTIAYNPSNPEEVLSKADSQVDLFRFDGLVLGGPCTLLGAFAAFAALKKVRVDKTPRRRRRAPPHI